MFQYCKNIWELTFTHDCWMATSKIKKKMNENAFGVEKCKGGARQLFAEPSWILGNKKCIKTTSTILLDYLNIICPLKLKSCFLTSFTLLYRYWYLVRLQTLYTSCLAVANILRLMGCSQYIYKNRAVTITWIFASQTLTTQSKYLLLVWSLELG